MRNIIVLLLLISFCVFSYNSCDFSDSEKYKKEREEREEKAKNNSGAVNDALSNEDYLTAYSIVDALISSDKYNNAIPTLNKKIMMAEIGSVLENEEMNNKTKSTKIIFIIKERGKYNSHDYLVYGESLKENEGIKAEKEMLESVISLAEAQDDLQLANQLKKVLKSYN